MYIVACVVELSLRMMLCGGEDPVFLALDGVKQGLGYFVDGQ